MLKFFSEFLVNCRVGEKILLNRYLTVNSLSLSISSLTDDQSQVKQHNYSVEKLLETENEERNGLNKEGTRAGPEHQYSTAAVPCVGVLFYDGHEF